MVTQLPLLVLRPDRRAGVVERFMSLQNLAPTALDVAGIANDGTFPTCSFGRLTGPATLAESGGIAACSPVVAEFSNEGKPRAAVYEGRFDFMLGAHRLEELYDWDADPSETRELARNPEHEALVSHLRRVTHSLLGKTHRLFAAR